MISNYVFEHYKVTKNRRDAQLFKHNINQLFRRFSIPPTGSFLCLSKAIQTLNLRHQSRHAQLQFCIRRAGLPSSLPAPSDAGCWKCHWGLGMILFCASWNLWKSLLLCPEIVSLAQFYALWRLRSSGLWCEKVKIRAWKSQSEGVK